MEYSHLNDLTDQVLAYIDEMIDKVESEIKSIIQQNESMKANFELMLSITGIGPIIAAEILSATYNFSRISTARRFACYAGVAPFSEQSGSSLNKENHVHPMANKRCKSLLSIAALQAVRHDNEIALYYERKLNEGKHKLLVLNNIKNKLVGRIYAVIKRGTPYVKRETWKNSQDYNASLITA
jgi:transposase